MIDAILLFKSHHMQQEIVININIFESWMTYMKITIFIHDGMFSPFDRFLAAPLVVEVIDRIAENC